MDRVKQRRWVGSRIALYTTTHIKTEYASSRGPPFVRHFCYSFVDSVIDRVPSMMMCLCNGSELHFRSHPCHIGGPASSVRILGAFRDSNSSVAGFCVFYRGALRDGCPSSILVPKVCVTCALRGSTFSDQRSSPFSVGSYNQIIKCM